MNISASGDFSEKNWKNKILLLAIVIITFVGAFIRFDDLGEKSLWEDELFSIDIILNHDFIPSDDTSLFRRIPVTEIATSDSFWTAKASDQSPPLYEIAGKIFLPFFGDSEAGLRATSALSSVVLILWMAVLAWRKKGSYEGILFFSLLLFFVGSGILVYYSQNARVYAMGTLLSAVIIIKFWQRLIHGWRNVPLPEWPEILVFIAAILSHYNVVVISGIILSLYFLESIRRKNYRACLRISSVALVLAGWLAISFHSFSMATKGQLGWMPKMSFQEAFIAVMESVMRNVFGEIQIAFFLLTMTIALFFFIQRNNTNTKINIQTKNRYFSSVLLIAAIVIFYHLCVAFIIQKSHIAHPRHLIFIVPAFYLVIAICIAEIHWNSRWLSMFLIVAITFSNYPLLHNYLKQPVSDYRSGAQFLAEHLDNNSPVIMMTMLNMGGYRYYLERKSPRNFQLKNYHAMGNDRELCEYLIAYPQLAFIGPAVHGERIDAIKSMCGNDFDIVQHGKDGVVTQVWKKRSLEPVMVQ